MENVRRFWTSCIQWCSEEKGRTAADGNQERQQNGGDKGASGISWLLGATKLQSALGADNPHYVSAYIEPFCYCAWSGAHFCLHLCPYIHQPILIVVAGIQHKKFTKVYRSNLCIQRCLWLWDSVHVVFQCFSTFSLKQNPLQKFWLLAELMGIAGNLSLAHSWGLNGRNSRQRVEKGFLGRGSQPLPSTRMSWGSAVSSPSRVQGRPRTASAFWMH